MERLAVLLIQALIVIAVILALVWLISVIAAHV